MQILSQGGIVEGPPHSEGGVPFVLNDTGRAIEEEGIEINIPRELAEDDAIYTFRGTNASVLDDILHMAGLSITDKVTTVKSGDIVICVRSVLDDAVRTFTGTIEEILDKINTSGGCKPIIQPVGRMQDAAGNQQPNKKKNGGKIDPQIDNPNSERWQKKKQAIQELSNNIHRLRLNVSRDIQSDDERIALTALVVAVMDRTAERIGNDDSADNGHFGVTGLQKKHINVVGNCIHLDYVGKSGTKHEKSFSDERISKALKRAIKNAPGKFIFETSDGFRIKSDKVNRYLQPFNISAKDLRGYLANKWIIKKLPTNSHQLSAKERKKIFNKALKETVADVGHGRGTLRKHYMIPELPDQYIEHGNIIDMKNLGYYQEGGPLKKGIEIEKEHKDLYEKIKKRLAEKNIPMPVTEQEFYSDIAKVHIKERKDYYDLLEKYVEKYTNKNSIPMKNKTDMFGGKSIGEMVQEYISNWKSYMPRYIVEFNDGYQTVTDYYRAINIAKKEDGTIIDAKEMKSEHFYKGEKMNEGAIIPDESELSDEPILEEEVIIDDPENPVEEKETEHQPSAISRQPSKDCGCFFVFIKKENPELVERLIEEDVNSNPELRTQVDEEYKKWRGGKL